MDNSNRIRFRPLSRKMRWVICLLIAAMSIMMVYMLKTPLMLPIYIASAILITYAGGIGAGFAAGVCMIGLTYFVFPHPADPLRGTHHAVTRLWLTAGIMPTVILTVGLLRRRNERLLKSIRMANRLLSESEQRYKSLFEHHPEAKVSCDPRGDVFSVNDAFGQLTGYSPDDALKLNVTALVAPDDWPRMEKGLKLALDGRPAQYEAGLLKANGERADVRITNVPIYVDGLVVGVYTLFNDLTMHNRISRQLAESEERYRLLAENSIDLITYHDCQKRIFYVSPSCQSLLGYDPEELIGTIGLEAICPDDRQEAHLCVTPPSETTEEDDRHSFVARFRHKNGGYLWMEAQRIRIRDERGNIKMIVCISRDITRRVEAEEEVRRREESYRLLVEQFPDAIIITEQGRVKYVNDTAVTLFGAESKERLMHDIPKLIPPEYSSQLESHMQTAMRGEAAEPAELKLVSFDGRTLDVEVESLPMLFEGRPAVHTLIRDITSSKKTQQMLQQAEKLNLIGQMAAGVAHEIRNPLTSIKGFIQLIQKGGGKAMYYDIMLSELDRIELIVSDLLMLAKPQAIHVRRHDIRSILEHVIALTESQAILAGVEIRFDLGDCVLRVECEENQIKQVFLNLIQNAIEAMESGGRIRVVAEREGDMAVIRVADTGPGIPSEVMKQLGQPFYTTKEKGTGLGLMVSYGIVKNHNGTIEASTRPNEGTTFTVRIPLVADSALDGAAAG